MKHNQRGFSVYEWLLVVAITAVILVVSIGCYLQLIQESKRLAFNALAHNFATAISMSHAHWLIQRPAGGSYSTLEIEGVTVIFNRLGWPSNIKDNNSTHQNSCYRLWYGLLQNSSSAEKSWGGLFQILAITSAQKGGSSHASNIHILLQAPGWCRYELTNAGNQRYFFDYIMKNGSVNITVPE